MNLLDGEFRGADMRVAVYGQQWIPSLHFKRFLIIASSIIAYQCRGLT
jgi:hypothetical protein